MTKSRIVLYSFLTVFLLLALYFYKNAAFVYSQLGNFYYKKNNIEQAQKYYEKSFSLGNTDSSVREIYVNSLINSPLSMGSQAKLVAVAEDKIQDEASIKAKYFLYDLKREIHNQYPENYIKQAPYNQQIVRWNRFPITYAYKNKSELVKDYIIEINKAFDEWEKTGIVLFEEVSGNADIVINFKDNKGKNMEYGRKYVIAYTVPVINSLDLQKMDVIFYLKDPDGNNFSRNQIYNTALHEIFHALGFMGHSFEPENIMYLAKDNNSLINDTRATLTDADISTLKLLYKIKPDISNKGKLKSEYLPYLLLGDDEEINVSKAKEAKNYIYHAPTLPSGYIDLAESLVANKRYPEAIRNLEKALRLADTYEMRRIVYYNLAVTYYYIAHKEMALDYIEKAAEIKDGEDLHFLRAEVLLNTDKENAIKEYEYLIKTYPSNADYTVRLANIYIQEHHYLKARKILKNYLKQNPNMKNDSKFASYGLLLF